MSVAAQFDNSSKLLKIVLYSCMHNLYKKCRTSKLLLLYPLATVLVSFGGNNPVQEMFTYLFTNIQDGLTSSLNIRVSDKFKFYVI